MLFQNALKIPEQPNAVVPKNSHPVNLEKIVKMFRKILTKPLINTCKGVRF